ncbi:MAG TPA: DUF192 domain-containing protein [Burkholderiales bacterium]|nr:DUF192 domain-containing protein [Burkholderiales bacterium]
MQTAHVQSWFIVSLVKTSARLAAGLTVAALASLIFASLVQADPLLTYPLRIKHHEVRVEVANTEAQRLRGLMHRERLAEDGGMIFVYPRPEVTAMWMKNTRIALSVAFIDADGRILNIEDMTPFTEDAHASRGAAAYSLEMNKSWFARRGIKAGDRVEGLAALPPAQ